MSIYLETVHNVTSVEDCSLVTQFPMYGNVFPLWWSDCQYCQLILTTYHLVLLAINFLKKKKKKKKFRCSSEERIYNIEIHHVLQILENANTPLPTRYFLLQKQATHKYCPCETRLLTSQRGHKANSSL